MITLCKCVNAVHRYPRNEHDTRFKASADRSSQPCDDKI